MSQIAHSVHDWALEGVMLAEEEANDEVFAAAADGWMGEVTAAGACAAADPGTAAAGAADTASGDSGESAADAADMADEAEDWERCWNCNSPNSDYMAIARTMLGMSLGDGFFCSEACRDIWRHEHPFLVEYCAGGWPEACEVAADTASNPQAADTASAADAAGTTAAGAADTASAPDAAGTSAAGAAATPSAAGAAADDDGNTVPTAKHMSTTSDAYIEGNSFATEGSANGRCV